MPPSLSLLVVHVIFSTKDHTPCLSAAITTELYPYLATIVRNADCECYRVGGAKDHVHLAIRLSRTVTIAKLIQELKASSSLWLKSKSLKAFAWQRGYAAFSVGPSDLPSLLRYIDDQEVHHRKHSFEDEFRALLRKYGIEHDERYMWD